MRLDHLAFRVRDRNETSHFFMNTFGYKKQTEFEIDIEDGSKAFCIALEPPEKKSKYIIPFSLEVQLSADNDVTFHMAPEIFVSSGPPGSLIDKWVQDWGHGIGGIHHLAYEVENIDEKMAEWKRGGWDFTTDAPLKCEDLKQVFTKPHPLIGVIIELIERKGQHGFCKDNVAKLMGSTVLVSKKIAN